MWPLTCSHARSGAQRLVTSEVTALGVAPRGVQEIHVLNA